MRLAKKLGVADRIAWFGQIPHAEVDDQYAWADVFAFTSLRDTTGTVVVEALAQGLPVLAFAHQGVGDVVTAECGIKIPVTNAREAIRDFADALVRLASDAELRESLSRGACERAREFLWDQNGQRMEKVYRQALAAATSLPYEVWSGRVYESPRHALDRTLDHETTTTSLSLETR
jgi:glycosyltransferase involved in cell wall biosynthesis